MGVSFAEVLAEKGVLISDPKPAPKCTPNFGLAISGKVPLLAVSFAPFWFKTTVCILDPKPAPKCTLIF